MMINFLKYLLLLVTSFFSIIAGGLGLTKTRNNEKPVNPSQTPTATFQKTSNFSLENAPSQSLRGKIATMSGEIMWQDRVATEAAKLASPITIQQGEKLITGSKSNLSLVFQDEATVTFSENTAIDVIQTLPANIVFSQSSGTAEYIKTGNYPASIRAMSLLIDDGGDITVSINPKKPVVTISIKSGNATIAYNDLNYISHEVKLSAGHTYTFSDGTRRGVAK